MSANSGDSQRKWRIRMLFLHGAMLAAPAALLLFHHQLQGRTTGVCVVQTLMSVDCPACGMTRSIMALFQGHLREALRIHPAGPIILGILGLMTGYLGFVLLTGRKGCAWRNEVRAYGMLDRLAIGALVVGWVGRLMAH